MLEGINYLHAKFQINILRKQKTLDTLAERKEKKIANSNELLSNL